MTYTDTSERMTKWSNKDETTAFSRNILRWSDDSLINFVIAYIVQQQPHDLVLVETNRKKRK